MLNELKGLINEVLASDPDRSYLRKEDRISQLTVSKDVHKIFSYLASSSSKQIGSILTDVHGMAHSSSTYIKTQTPDTVYHVLKALSTEKKNLSRKQLFAFWSFSFTTMYIQEMLFFCLEIEYVSSFSFSFFFKLELHYKN